MSWIQHKKRINYFAFEREEIEYLYAIFRYKDSVISTKLKNKIRVEKLLTSVIPGQKNIQSLNFEYQLLRK